MGQHNPRDAVYPDSTLSHRHSTRTSTFSVQTEDNSHSGTNNPVRLNSQTSILSNGMARGLHHSGHNNLAYASEHQLNAANQRADNSLTNMAVVEPHDTCVEIEQKDE